SAGTQDLTLGGLTLADGSGLASNYKLAESGHTLKITPAEISAITGITAEDKTYDGTTDVTLNTDDAEFEGMIAGDDLEVATATGAFEDKDAGSNKTVNITGLTLGGEDAGNYTLADTTATAQAEIFKATI